MEYTIEVTSQAGLAETQSEVADLADGLIGELKTDQRIMGLVGFGLGDGGFGVVFNLESQDIVAAAAHGVAIFRSALRALDLPASPRRLEVRPPEDD